MPRVRIAMGQMLVEGGEPERNLRRAAAMAVRAAEQGCDVVVLPECLNYGWTHPSARGAAPVTATTMLSSVVTKG